MILPGVIAAAGLIAIACYIGLPLLAGAYLSRARFFFGRR